MIVAITGGTGFVGKMLVAKHLSLGDEVRILTRKEKSCFSTEVLIYQADLESVSLGLLNDFFDSVEVFYHCAGEIKNKDKMYSVHVEGTRKLIEAAEGNIGRWVQLSSTGVYGQVRQGQVTESSQLSPQGSYEETKLMADELVVKAGDAGSFDYVIVQPCAIVGKNMPNQSVFQLIHAVNKGRFAYIGFNEATVNYTHVENVVEALFQCATQKAASKKSYIVAEHMLLRDMIKIICRELNRPMPKLVVPESLARFLAVLMSWNKSFPLTVSRVNALTSYSVYSSQQIERDLKFTPVIQLDQAIQELVLAYKARLQ